MNVNWIIISFQIYMHAISFFKERTTSFSNKSYDSSFHFKDFLDFFHD